jgi:tetratricopeptide (TPR) repeat protein
MAQEKEKQEIQAFFQNPWYHFVYRHALDSAAKLRQKKNENEINEELHKFFLEDDFITRFTHDYSFYQYVRKTMMAKKWYWKQVKELGYLVLLDLLHPEVATPKNAEREPKSNSGEKLPDVFRIQNSRRTRRNYPEIFFTLTRTKRKGRRTKKFTCFSTIFNDMPLENEDKLPTALGLLAIQDERRKATIGKENLESMRQLMAGFRMVDVGDLEGLKGFWLGQTESLNLIANTFYQSTEKTWILDAIKGKKLIVEQMYQLIDVAVALRWFRTLKSKNKKDNLLRKEFRIKYNSQMTKRAVDLTFEWFENPIQAADLVFRGADAYLQENKLDVAIGLYEECLKQVGLEKEDVGLCYHNIAAIYMKKKKPRKYLIWLLKALEAFEEVESPFDVGITWAHLAEAYHRLKRKQDFEDARSQSKRILSSSGLSNYKLTQAHLLVADCAERLKHTDWEKEAVKIGLISASKLEDLEYFPYFDQRRHFLDLGIDTVLGEMRPGSIKRPPMFGWHKDSTRYVAIPPKV